MAVCNLRKIVTVPFKLDAMMKPDDGGVQYRADPMIVADPVVLQFRVSRSSRRTATSASRPTARGSSGPPSPNSMTWVLFYAGHGNTVPHQLISPRVELVLLSKVLFLYQAPLERSSRIRRDTRAKASLTALAFDVMSEITISSIPFSIAKAALAASRS